MKSMDLSEISAMSNDELIKALADNSYDMGVAKVYLEADNYNNDENNVELLTMELKRRLNKWTFFH